MTKWFRSQFEAMDSLLIAGLTPIGFKRLEEGTVPSRPDVHCTSGPSLQSCLPPGLHSLSFYLAIC